MRDEFVDTCGLCDAPLRMGQRCACGDNWRATPPAPAQPPHPAYPALIREAARLLQLRTYGDPVDVARSSFIDNALCDVAMALRRTADLLPRVVTVGTQDEPKGDTLDSANGANPDAQPASAEQATVQPTTLQNAIAWGRLYDRAQALCAEIGYAGSVSTDDDEVELLMDALHAIDGGEWMPGLLPAVAAPAPSAEQQPVAVQACRPEDRAMLATTAGAELLRAVTTALALPPAVATAPERIWLQISDHESDLDEPIDDIANASLTWCWHSIGGAEVEYVRADLAAPPALHEAARMALDAIVRHWDEFGPADGFDEVVDQARRTLIALRAATGEGE